MTTAVDDADGLEDVLAHVQRSRGFDLTGYKRASMRRRVRHRMREVGIEGFPEYLDRLEVDPDESTSPRSSATPRHGRT